MWRITHRKESRATRASGKEKKAVFCLVLFVVRTHARTFFMMRISLRIDSNMYFMSAGRNLARAGARAGGEREGRSRGFF